MKYHMSLLKCKRTVDYYTTMSHVFACFINFTKAFENVNYWNNNTCYMALYPGLPGWAITRKVNQSGFTEARDSEWQQCHHLGHMQICTSSQTDNHTSTHHSVFYRLDALSGTQPTASKHWTTMFITGNCSINCLMTKLAILFVFQHTGIVIKIFVFDGIILPSKWFTVEWDRAEYYRLFCFLGIFMTCCLLSVWLILLLGAMWVAFFFIMYWHMPMTLCFLHHHGPGLHYGNFCLCSLTILMRLTWHHDM